MKWAPRFLRDRTALRASAVVFVVAAFLVAVHVVLQAFSLSGEQVAERDLGEFDAAVGLGAVAAVRPGDGALAEDVRDAVRAAGTPDAAVSVVSVDVQLAVPDPPRTPFVEADWVSGFFTGRYALTAGRWPTAPGEIAVTGTGTIDVGLGEALPVLADKASFTVVGVAEDRYEPGPGLLAAPGTWAALDPALAESFPSLSASVTAYWSGGDDADVLRRLTAVPARYEVDPSEAIASSLRTRGSLTSAERESWVDRTPAAYSVPAVVLPLAAVLLLFGLCDRRFRRNADVLTSLGIRPARAAVNVATPAVVWAFSAVIAGVLAGVALGLVGRAVVDGLVHPPLSPMPSPAEPALHLVAVTTVGSAVGLALLWWRTAGSAIRNTGQARKAAVVLLGLVAAVQAWWVDSLVGVMVFAGTITVCVSLLTPELVARVVRAVPGDDPRTRLARARLLRDRHVPATVAILAAVVGNLVGFAILVDSITTGEQSRSSADVAPGQVVLNGRGGYLQPPSPAVVDVARSSVPEHEPVSLRYLGADDESVTFQRDDWGFVLALDTPDQVASLIGRPLRAPERDSLVAGGLVLWEEGDDRVLVRSVRGRVVATTSPLPAAVADFPAVAWKDGTRGVVLSSTARDLRLPLADGAVFYSGVSDEAARAIREAVLRAGLDPKEVLVHEEPARVVTPIAVRASVVALGLLTLVTTLVVSWGRAGTLRGHARLLRALGIPVAWTRRVLLLEQASVTFLSSALAALITVPPLLVAVVRLPGFVPAVPWPWVAVILTTFVASTAITTALCATRLRSL
ncbi:hypothetical protein FHX81_7871 [Saccharothrix saharensis]|uniref:FtsX-like permease family protein n=1 Tax=Saccharothrix saharensis TaxID=571190 RepID=A0A543JRB5_9PSEU|nr:hypothetical protein [Saccharothrix saharensis]TQM85391.1 hypothetical protein FHX81_7871 [Saccharothrix saharensis]